jgi:hypothetical protein
VVLVALGAAAAAVLAEVPVVELGEPPELPHDASSSASATISADRLGARLIAVCSGTVRSTPSPCTSPAGACHYPGRDHGP